MPPGGEHSFLCRGKKSRKGRKTEILDNFATLTVSAAERGKATNGIFSAATGWPNDTQTEQVLEQF